MEDLRGAAEKIAALMKTLITIGGLKLKYRITAGAGAADPDGLEAREIYVEIIGPDAPLLTQRGGELLRALEHIAAKIVRLENEEHDKISFDSNNFKALRAREMRLAADTAAERVQRSGIPFSFQPMSSRERRMLHLALRDYDDLETESSGEGLRRFVVLYRKGEKHVPPPMPSVAGWLQPIWRTAQWRRPRPTPGQSWGPRSPLVSPTMPNEPDHLPFLQDTIVAISTPPGRGGIGIVRLSGSQARSIAEPILKLRQPLAHAIARFAEILDNTADGAKLDEAVVTYFAAPNSYTAEDVVEISAHGSPVVLEYLVRHALGSGARLARAGEFTERAFLSGRIDLTQAEAVRDLIDAQTILQARSAAEQMGGALSRRIAPVKEQLFSLIAVLEAGIDFADDDIDVMPSSAITARVEAIQEALAPISASYAAGRIVHDGLTLAIVGKPNAGKSSLFNRLVERDRAIVTPVAGTTRDLVTERISIAGIPVELIDTAGLRSTIDQVEAIGIEKTREAMADADLILALIDGADVASWPGGHATGDKPWHTLLHDRRTILVFNKIDLLPSGFLEKLEQQTLDFFARYADASGVSHPPATVGVSALTGEGVAALRGKILSVVSAGSQGPQTGMLTSVRHYEAIHQAEEALERTQQAVLHEVPHEMLLIDLHAALQGLDTLTGATTADDILNRIFSTFCIGK